VGLFGRSLHDLYTLAEETLDFSPDTDGDTHAAVKKILYPIDFFPMPNGVDQILMDEFITALEEHLGIKRTKVYLADEWEKAPPPSASGQSLQKYMAKVGF